METSTRTRKSTGRPPYWVITHSGRSPGRRRRREDAYRDILTLETAGNKILPLFGSEAAASEFAALYETQTGLSGWRATQAWSGELLTLLSASGSGVGACSGVGAVTFDPPGEAIEDDVRSLKLLGVRCFMDQLLGRGDRWWRSR